MKREKIIDDIEARSKKQEARSVTKSLILYIDASDEMAEISIWRNGQKAKEIRWLAGRELSKTLSQKYLELLEKVPRRFERDSQSKSIKQFQRSNISGICVFVGPGSFTGLRIGISFANALAFGLGIPIYEIKERGKINLSKKKELAVPFYGSQPRITEPKNK